MLISIATTNRLHGVIAVAITAIGVRSVLQQPLEVPAAVSWIGIYAPFGIALFLGVIVVFAWHALPTAYASNKTITDLARGLSRQIYLLLYSLAGIRMLAFLISRPPLSLADAMKVMQCYATLCVLALLTIRVLTAMCHFYLIPRSLRIFHRR